MEQMAADPEFPGQEKHLLLATPPLSSGIGQEDAQLQAYFPFLLATTCASAD